MTACPTVYGSELPAVFVGLLLLLLMHIGALAIDDNASNTPASTAIESGSACEEGSQTLCPLPIFRNRNEGDLRSERALQDTI